MILVGGWVAMFWNVECLFDPFDDPLKNDDEFTAKALRHWTWQRFEKKRDGIAQTVLALADETGELPALIGLAEVENRMVVSQLIRKTVLEELGYSYVHRESPDERGIDVALLYRKDIFRVIAADSLTVPGFATRDILYVKMIEMPGQAGQDAEVSTPSVYEDAILSSNDGFTRTVANPFVMPGSDRASVHVFIVHFPSKRGGAKVSDSRRSSALGVLDRAIDSLLRIDAQGEILVMGDFNDTDCQVTGLVAPPFDGLPAAPGTLKYHGRWERIDHFFVSPSLDAHTQIFAPPFLLEEDASYLGTKPRRTYIGPRYNGGLSDHLPIYLKTGE